MFRTYFFLQKLSHELNGKITGWKIASCYSQNKDELVLGCCSPQETLYFICQLQPEKSLITFSGDIHRARRNSVDLFQEVLDKTITSVEQVPFDRSFYLQLTDGSQLLFKMHGSRSNILLVRNGEVQHIFKGSLHADRALKVASLGKTINLRQPSGDDISQLRKLVGANERVNQMDDSALLVWIRQIENSSTFTIERSRGARPTMNISEKSTTGESYESAIEASNAYSQALQTDFLLEKEKEKLKITRQKRIKSIHNYIQRSEQELEKLKARRSHEEIANIIMAHLHELQGKTGSVFLNDFYNETTIQIKLKVGVSPQQLAETYYRKAKNEGIQSTKIQENINAKQEQIASVEKQLALLEQVSNYKQLKNFAKIHEPSIAKQDSEKMLPYHLYEVEGYSIMIGKNARANDELTQKIARKNDLWLHARDVAGSHVVVRHKPQANFPKTVIEKAASYAAYFSKRKNDTLCPVIVTEKKFVRKKKGTPPGQVVVEREEVVMIKPCNPAKHT